MRWSVGQLEAIREKVVAVLGATCTFAAVDPMTGAVAVSVRDDVRVAERVIAGVVDPCAVSVDVGEPPVPLPIFRPCPGPTDRGPLAG